MRAQRELENSISANAAWYAPAGELNNYLSRSYISGTSVDPCFRAELDGGAGAVGKALGERVREERGESEPGSAAA